MKEMCNIKAGMTKDQIAIVCIHNEAWMWLEMMEIQLPKAVKKGFEKIIKSCDERLSEYAAEMREGVSNGR